MRKQDAFDVIYTHTEGEPLCIVHSGIPYPAGSTILEKRAFLEQRYDWLRKALMREPRGHKDMFGVFLTPPSSPEFDAGLIYIDGTEYSHMWPRHHRGQHGDGGQRPGAARSGRHHPHPLRDHRRPGRVGSRLGRRAGAVDALRERAGLCGRAGYPGGTARLRRAVGRHRVGRQLLRHRRPVALRPAHLAGQWHRAVAHGPDRARPAQRPPAHPAPDRGPYQQSELHHVLARAHHRGRLLQERARSAPASSTARPAAPAPAR